jgi:hypothetical protein
MRDTAHGARGDAPKLPTHLYSLVEHFDHGRILGWQSRDIQPSYTLESHERPSRPIDEIVICAADGQRRPSSAPGDMHA